MLKLMCRKLTEVVVTTTAAEW